MGGGQENFRGRLARLRRDGGSGGGADRPPGQDAGRSREGETDAAVDARSNRGGAVRGPDDAATAPPSGAGRRKRGDPVRSGAGMPMWLRAKLARKGERATADALLAEGVHATADPLAAAAARWERTTGDPAGLAEQSTSRGTFVARTQRVPVHGTTHGAWRLDEAQHADPAAFARFTNDPALSGLDTGRAVYLDTETSGLGGGAGVYVYMVGLGWFEGDGDAAEWVSWQGFLRDPGEEPALLQAVADRVGAAPALVSFFGKSFDRHRLEDKMRIAGVTPPFADRPHLDLFHPLRRLTLGAFQDTKLQTMERELLGFRRERDLPGALAPAAWFDYLAGRPHLLEGVFLHNHEDVLSLGVLAGYLGRALAEERVCGAALPGPAARRAVALATTTKDRAEARLWAERALDRGAEGDDRRSMQLLAAESARMTGDSEAARSLYRTALEECATDRAAVRLFRGASMLLEHALGDPENARTMAERGLRLARELGCPAAEVGDLERRVARLG
ncbi:MAG: ribonuclease H-like domain-containing protein [Planctomycetota bacterium]